MGLILSSCLLVLIGTVLLFWHANRDLGDPSLLKTSFRLPLLGNLLSLGDSPHLGLIEVQARLGVPAFRLKLGSCEVVILSTHKAIKEVLQSQGTKASSRPHNSMFLRFITGNFSDLVFCPYNPRWRLLRKVYANRFFPQNKIDHLSSVIQQEISQFLIPQLDAIAQSNQAWDPCAHLKCFTMSLIANLTFGRHYEPHEPDFREMSDIMDEGFALAGAGHISDFLPLFSFVDLPTLTRFKPRWMRVMDIFAEQISNHLEGLDLAQDPRDFTDVLLGAEYESTSPDNGTKSCDQSVLQRKHVLYSIMQVFAAGLDTTATTLSWLILELLLNPTAQTKLATEISSFSANAQRVLRYEDSKSMPYFQAVLAEVFRLHPAAPLSVPHLTTEPVHVTVDETPFTIPPNTMIFPHLYAAHRDPEIWGADANLFRPERFLSTDETGKHSLVIPFSMGPRKCPGELLARIELFHVITTLVARYRVVPLPQHAYSNRDGRFGITVPPLPFFVGLKVQPAHASPC